MARNMTGSNMIPLGSMGSPSAALKPAAGVSLLLPSYLAGSNNVKQEKSDGECCDSQLVLNSSIVTFWGRATSNSGRAVDPDPLGGQNFLTKNFIFSCLIQRRSLQPYKRTSRNSKNEIYWLFYVRGSILSFWIRIRIRIRIHSFEKEPLWVPDITGSKVSEEYLDLSMLQGFHQCSGSMTRIRGSASLTNGSGFFYLLLSFLTYIYIILQRLKVTQEVTKKYKSRSLLFLTIFAWR